MKRVQDLLVVQQMILPAPGPHLFVVVMALVLEVSSVAVNFPSWLAEEETVEVWFSG
jgi:hypothetical protein